MNTIVIGGYGYTGRLICKELSDNGIEFSVAGRDESKLEAFKDESSEVHGTLLCDLRKEEDLDKILDYDIIVNCAGPFTEESALLLEKVASSGKVYMDITGELGFVKDSHEKYDLKAKASNTMIIHGAAFESMISDLLLEKVLPDNDEVDTIKVYYHFNQKRVSPGTKITMKLSKYRKLLGIKDGHWKELDLINEFQDIEVENHEFTAVPYPLPEVAFTSWNHDLKEINTYLLLNRDDAKFISPNKSLVSELTETLDRLRSIKKDGPDKEERAGQISTIYYHLSNHKDAWWKLQSHDMYGITAKCIRILVQEASRGNKINGVVSPASLFKKDTTILDQLEIQYEQL